MSMIALCCHDTADNKRTDYTRRALESLAETVDWSVHRLIVIDNGSCQETKDLLRKFSFINELSVISKLITNSENIGTAKAINQAWKLRLPGEHLIKMDNDVTVNELGWVEQMEEAISRDPYIGQVGLKRKDLMESPNRTDHLRSTLKMLPHRAGDTWIVVESVQHVIGTCVMHNSKLIDAVGGLYQMDGLYGFDDCLMSLRSSLAGFSNCFLPHIEIDHIDTGGDSYTQWKRDYAAEWTNKFNEVQKSFLSGKTSIKFEL